MGRLGDSAFVGRHREITALKSSLDLAFSGRAQIAILAGDPGVGKTRIAQELASIANARNADVFWGHCYEGEGAPPYWPWLQIFRSHIDQWDAESIQAAMGSGAGAIGEIVPELRSKLLDLEPPPPFDPPELVFSKIPGVASGPAGGGPKGGDRAGCTGRCRRGRPTAVITD